MRTICFIFKARDTIIRVECAYNGEGRKNRRNRLVMVRLEARHYRYYGRCLRRNFARTIEAINKRALLFLCPHECMPVRRLCNERWQVERIVRISLKFKELIDILYHFLLWLTML